MRSYSFYYILLFLFLFVSCKSDDPVGEIKPPGTPAPGFTYTSLNGATVSLSDFQGKVVYLFFYGADCPHCRSNGPVTETQIHQQFRDNDNFVALGLDTWNLPASANNSFRSATGISYTLLLNARQSLVDYYGSSSAYDRSVVISPEGNILYQGTGYVDTDVATVVDVITDELAKL